MRDRTPVHKLELGRGWRAPIGLAVGALIGVPTGAIDAGGTITHHHAVGRDHRPWYDQQRPGRFADALRAAKLELDPKAVLNPGVLIDPDR